MKILLLFAATFVMATQAYAQTTDSGVRHSVVKVWSTTRSVNLSSPWKFGDQKGSTGSGVWLGDGRVLTNAHVLQNSSQISIQLYDSSQKIPARTIVMAPEMDLAIVEIEDARPLADVAPLAFLDNLPPLQAEIQAYGFPVGGSSLSVTKGIISRIEYVGYPFGGAGLRVQVDAALNPGNSGGPIVLDDQLAGVASSKLRQSDNIGYFIPAEEINLFLQDVEDGKYDGKPKLHVTVQKLLNDGLRANLGLDPQTTGVWVREIRVKDEGYPLHVGDVITKIGQYDVDNSGMTRLSEGVRVSLFYHVPYLYADGRVPLTVLREGKSQVIQTPVQRGTSKLVPYLKGNQPSYFVFGPLVFTAASAEYLEGIEKLTAATNTRQRAGGLALLQLMARRHSPLLTRRFDFAAFDGEQLVMVATNFLPHRLSLGYSSPQTLVLGSVNGKSIRNMRHLVETLRDGQDEKVTFEFLDRNAETLVFPRKDMLAATWEILRQNGIPQVASPELLPLWDGRTQ